MQAELRSSVSASVTPPAKAVDADNAATAKIVITFLMLISIRYILSCGYPKSHVQSISFQDFIPCHCIDFLINSRFFAPKIYFQIVLLCFDMFSKQERCGITFIEYFDRAFSSGRQLTIHRYDLILIVFHKITIRTVIKYGLFLMSVPLLKRL